MKKREKRRRRQKTASPQETVQMREVKGRVLNLKMRKRARIIECLLVHPQGPLQDYYLEQFLH